ncbi:MAG: Lsr2 family protein [Microbacterium sp.]|nr:Lsr2 family protein [Microbacterium sp.]
MQNHQSSEADLAAVRTWAKESTCQESHRGRVSEGVI